MLRNLEYMDSKRSETNNITYSKPKCVSRIIVFLVICLVGSILVAAPFMGLFLNNGDNAVASKLAPDLMAMACSAFLLVALAIENKIEKLDLWMLRPSALQMKVVSISILLGLLWQLAIYLICQLSNTAYPHPTAEPSPLLISIVSTGLLGPFAEEMLFRKWLVSMMERGGFNPVAIIVCSSILFFCAHLGDSFLRVDTLVFAIPLCYLLIRYHDVRYCFIAHAVCNLAGIVFPLLIH